MIVPVQPTTTSGLIDTRSVADYDSSTKTYSARPNVDYMYGPYADKTAAFAALSKVASTTKNLTALVIGRTVGILQSDGSIKEYWFQSACASENDLVEKGVTEIPIATSSVLGGVKSTTTGTTANRDYNVEVNTNGTMKVNVPWVQGDTNAIESIKTASGATLTPSSKAVTLPDYAGNYTTGDTSSTTIANPTSAPVMYSFDTITSLNVAAVVSAKYETVIFFTAGDSFTLTASATNQKVVGDIDITAGNSYVMAILSGNIVVQEATTASESYSAS